MIMVAKLVVLTQNVHVDVIKSRDSENDNIDIILQHFFYQSQVEYFYISFKFHDVDNN